jgi:hypothetical protein
MQMILQAEDAPVPDADALEHAVAVEQPVVQHRDLRLATSTNAPSIHTFISLISRSPFRQRQRELVADLAAARCTARTKLASPSRSK